MKGTGRQEPGNRIRPSQRLLHLMLAALFACLLSVVPGGADSVFAYENGYDIMHIDMDIDVNENNSYDITEIIDVRFDEGAGKHGIIRSIPTRNRIFREDGSQGSNEAKISNVSVNMPYSLEKESGQWNLRIGSADTVVEGDVRYVISYHYDIGPDRLRGEDEFYYNIVGTQWDTTVESVTFSVHFPKEFLFNRHSLGFTHGYAHSGDYEGILYNVEDNTISGNFDRPLDAYQGLTMRLVLPDGYFVRSGGPMEAISTGFLGIPVLSFLVFLFLYLTKMRNKKPVEPVEVYPPDDLSPLWIGYYYDGRVDTKDITSMLIWLASKGYLTIRDKGPEDYEIVLLKDYYTEDDKQAYTFYDGLLRLAKEDAKTGEIVVPRKKMEKKFYRTVDKIRSSMNNKTNRKKYLLETGPVKGLAMLFGCLSIVLSLFSAIYFVEYDTFTAVFFTIAPAVFLAVLMPMLHINSKMDNSLVVRIVLLIMIVAFTFVLLAFYFALGAKELLDWNLWQTKAAAAGVILGVLTICLSLRMRKRTPAANEMLGRIRGFRRFLETAEKDRLEMLVEESPGYFYNILPYAYVLGISAKWIRQFDDIAVRPPEWYSGGAVISTRDITDSLNHTMDQIREDMTSMPASSGGSYSSSSSGGGWSSSGSSGGGSSGGGSGGGGGSSW